MGEGVSKGIVFFSIPFFTNILDKNQFGLLSLYWITVPLFSVFFDFSQRSYVKNYFIHDKNNILTLLSTLNLFILCVFIIMSVIFYIKDYIGIFLINPTIDYFVLCSAAFFAMIECSLSYFQIKGDFIKYNLTFLIRSSFPFLISVPLMFYIYPNEYAFIISQLVVFLLIATFNLKKTNYTRNLQNVFELLRPSLIFSLPLIPAMLSVLALSYADRFIINFYQGTVSVAEYSIGYTIGSVFAAIFLSTNKMWQKFILVSLKKNKIKKVRKAAKTYFFVILVIGIGFIFFGDYLIVLISNDSYLSASNYITPIIIGMFFYFLYTLYSNIPFFYKDVKYLMIPAIFAAIINIILNFIYIPKYGIIAAAYTTAISYFFQFLIIYFICTKKYNIDILFNASKK